MTTASMRRAAAVDYVGRVDWGATAVWLLCFSLVAYLGLKGGGYDALVYDQVGIAVWWIVLVAVAVGALPRRSPGSLAWAAIGLLAAFVAWTALSLGWTESAERTAADLARVAGYLGVFALAVFGCGPNGPRRLVGAVAAGIALISVVALLSRFEPSWFAGANQTASLLSANQERLSYPLHYWNAVGALIAIGLPLVLQVATGARSVLLRAAAAAALPALALAIYFTLSRSGIAAAVLALAVFLGFSSDRLAKLPTLLLTGAGGALLIVAANQRDALQDGLLNATAEGQGDQMLAIALGVCAVVGLAQAAISLAPGRIERPPWAFVSRRQSLITLTAVALIGLVAASALGAPGRASDAWAEFKRSEGPGKGSGRLASAAGQNRYQLWSAAVKENASEPLTGTGSGTFEFWWARNGDVPEIVRDTHSLYLQTLGELGIVGLALLLAFLLTVLIGGARAALLAGARERTPLAAALAGCAAFCLTAAFDWMWQIPVLPVSMLVLAAVLVTAGARPVEGRGPAFGAPLRVGVAATAVAAIVAIAIPLASTSLVRESEADFRRGDLAAALGAARSAQNAQPSAATPRLQQALVLEAAGDFAAAATAARAATERESTNWRTWLILSRIEAERGRAAASVDAFRRARSLNPQSSLFDH
jgi:hypothetical protein